ncbi:MAG: efflux RND transporter periplasmic adaptor subunit [Bythopirellula sp.]
MTLTSPVASRPRFDRAATTPTSADCAPDQRQLMLNMAQADSATAAAQAVTQGLPDELQPCRLAIGFIGGGGNCHLLAVTGRNQLGQNSEQAIALEAAFDETILANRTVAYAQHQPSAPGAKTHERLVRLVGSQWAGSHPLRDGAGRVVGAAVLWSEQGALAGPATTWLEGNHQPIGTMLQLVSHAQRGVWQRLVDRVRSRLAASRRRNLYAAALLSIVAVLALPIPYKVNCGCVLEPVTRRYIAAPFDTTLARTLVKPGDVITTGQPLVEFDGREIRWELVAQQAALEKAQKTRDAALADRKTSAAQLARLEMQQLQHQIALLKHREANLQISSPFDGVIISGDLQRVEGAPVTTGQTLLEVAPLDRVVVEVAIPERSIAHLTEQPEATIRLDAFDDESWSGALHRIHPRAEIRATQQVFVGELELNNPARTLRPGMRGEVKVDAGWAPTGWILFHRPYRVVTRWLGW